MPTETKHKPSPKYSALAFSALILSVVAFLFAAFIWQQQDSIRSNTAPLKQKLAQLTSTLQQTQADIATSQKRIAQLMSQNGNPDQQATNEASYLVRAANLHLTTRNVNSSIQLLQMAKQRLETVITPAAGRLKSAIAHDITTLSALPQLDVGNLLAQLDQLSQQIASLPTNLQMSPQTVSKTNNDTAATTWWGKVKRNLGGLKRLFIIRRLDKPMAPLLNPQQIVFLKENLRLKLSQAQWAVLHNQPKLYQQSVNIAIQWLKEHAQNQPATQDIIKKLQALAIINISPPLPTTLKSVNALNSKPSPSSTQ